MQRDSFRITLQNYNFTHSQNESEENYFTFPSIFIAVSPE